MARGSKKESSAEAGLSDVLDNSGKKQKAKKKGGSLFLWILVALSVSAVWWAQHAMV